MTAKSDQARTEKAILAALEELGGKMIGEQDVVYGEKMQIRKGMSLRAAGDWYHEQADEQEEHTNFARIYDYRPYDGAYCFWNAMVKLYAGASHQAKRFQSMFGTHIEPPRMLTVPSGVGTTTQIPWGQFQIPGLKNCIFTSDSYVHDEKGSLFMLHATGPKRMRFAIEGIFNAVELELRTNSLYRGKAIDGQETPNFVDVFSVDPAKVIYSRQVMEDLGAMIWAKIRNPEEFSAEELKSAVVVHGPYGTGKTLACMVTGQIAVTCGHTFIRAKPGRDSLSQMLQTAALYPPAVVFCEDVDQEMGGRSNSITRLLDDLDGMEAKGARIISVFTTNYPEKIHEGMSRPGRIDAFIEINDLDLEGVRALVESRLGDLLEDEIDWEAVFEAAQGYKPAFVTQFASRTKAYLVNRYGTAKGHLVGTEQLVAAANGMRSHHERTQPRVRKVEDPMVTALKDAMADTIHDHIDSDYLTNSR